MVEANNRRLFRQILEQKRENQKKIQENQPNQESQPTGCANWTHQGHENAASRVSVAVWCQLGERLLPQSSRDPLPLVFPYKYQFQQGKKGRRVGLEFFFIF